eukprot:CAMPEP_0194207928 /NCGR_PEP_ID=MMETSP0156-20130528/6541_1 /TAXON_ID=33649 /ORGANISM="Thalassionema nitzschioides, Strain L26-B" /LENGTH=227 /DNA_ID=CAMNT_0038934803 /DNA_START=254 /DNA_END=937 /DNA_ORIENTATION=-
MATGSILYAYFYKKGSASSLSLLPLRRAPAFVLLSLGLGMASQTVPKLQLPVAYGQPGEAKNEESDTTAGPQPAKSSSSSFQVRCPFDFTDSKKGAELWGIERATRHPGLWSMGLVGLGQALLVPSLPQRVWWSMPALVALIGGWHTDSRFERGMGGTLTPEYKAQTSNIPFVAMLLGKQQQPPQLLAEVKPLNVLLATSMAGLWVLSRKGGSPTKISNTIASTLAK